MLKQKLNYLPLILATLVTVTSGAALVAGRASAAVKTASATVGVSSACTLALESGSSNSHAGSGVAGQTSEIAGAKMAISCNEPNGYAIYAVGAGSGSNVTELVGSNGLNISTGTSGTNSYWSFKVAGSGDINVAGTPINYANYQSVPGSYAKIASYAPATADDAAAATLSATYQVYMKSTQAAGTYTGAVKYALTTTGSAPTE